MKKILSIMLVCFTVLAVSSKVHAQATPATISFKATDGVTAHSTTSGVDTAIGTFRLIGNYDVVTIQAIVTKTSGTVGSKVYLQASLDGVNFDNLDSLTNANQSVNFKHFKVGVSNYYWYRLFYPTSGTQVSSISGYYVARKQYGQ